MSAAFFLAFLWLLVLDELIGLFLLVLLLSRLSILVDVCDTGILDLVKSERLEAVLWLLRSESLLFSFLNDGNF